MQKGANLSSKKPQKKIINFNEKNVTSNYGYSPLHIYFISARPFFIIYIEHTGTNHLLIVFCFIKKIYNERKQWRK